MGPGAGMDVLEKRKPLAPAGFRTPDRPAYRLRYSASNVKRQEWNREWRSIHILTVATVSNELIDEQDDVRTT